MSQPSSIASSDPMSEAGQTRMGGGGNIQDKGAKPVELDFMCYP